jgi:hypothetical protein
MPKHLIEVTRSFSYLLNVGNYENRQFFCSQKAEVEEVYAVETSERLYDFCKSEVMKSVNAYIADQKILKVASNARGKGKQEIREISKESADLDAGEQNN